MPIVGSGKTPWKIHEAAWSDCRRCPLYSVRKKVVLARGKLPCDVLFVGEAPGASEDVIGQPFVGPAGVLLDSQIREAMRITGKKDIRVAFTNLVACIPRCPDADSPDYFRKIAEPSVESIRQCKTRLTSFIRDVARPKKVVAVGTLAAKHLADFSVDIIHPAAILRAGIEQKGLMVQRVIVALADVFDEV